MKTDKNIAGKFMAISLLVLAIVIFLKTGREIKVLKQQVDSLNLVTGKLNCKNPDTIIYGNHRKVVICNDEYGYEVK